MNIVNSIKIQKEIIYKHHALIYILTQLFFGISQQTESRHSNLSDFQMVFDDCIGFVSGYFNSTSISAKSESHFLDPNDNHQFSYSLRPSISPRPSMSPRHNMGVTLDTIDEEEEDEPPLLEELEIYPEQIRDKAMTMINPFMSDRFAIETFLYDIDLSGPIFFCFLFGAFLFLAGKVFIFRYISKIPWEFSSFSIISRFNE